jgi:hypothetical protein
MCTSALRADRSDTDKFFENFWVLFLVSTLGSFWGTTQKIFRLHGFSSVLLRFERTLLALVRHRYQDESDGEADRTNDHDHE